MCSPGNTVARRVVPASATVWARAPSRRTSNSGDAPMKTPSGVPTQYVCFERQIHGFITMGRVIDEANTAVALCANALQKAFA